MITVEGGFAKVVNVESEIEGNFVKTTIYMKMTYADNKARENLIKRLRKEGYPYSASGNNDDTRFRVVRIPLFVYVSEKLKEEK